MTRHDITRWTCDTCGDQIETEPNEQPKGWVGYGFTKPDVPASEHAVLGHLCRGCARDIRNALGGRD